MYINMNCPNCGSENTTRVFIGLLDGVKETWYILLFILLVGVKVHVLIILIDVLIILIGIIINIVRKYQYRNELLIRCNRCQECFTILNPDRVSNIYNTYEQQDGQSSSDRNKNFKITIRVLAIVVIIVSMVVGLIKDKKSEELVSQARVYMGESKYDESIIELKKSIEVDSKNEEAVNLLEVATTFKELDEKYKNKNYVKAKELIDRIYRLEGGVVFKNKLDEMSRKVEEGIVASSTINSINEAETRVKELKEIKAYINRNIELYFMSGADNFDGITWGQPNLHGMKGYNVEVRAQSEDPMISTAVGFYFVEAKTRNVYKMDVINAQYFLVE